MPYIRIVNYAAKDPLISGDPLKLTKGVELGAEFDAIAASIASSDAAIALRALNASPALTGIPSAPTAAVGTNTTQLATTAHVFAERANTVTLTNKTIDLANNTLVATSSQLAAAITDESGTGPLVFSVSPAFTGVPTTPTASPGTNTTQLASTAFVVATAFNSALPVQAGNAGKYVTTDGATASWGTISLAPVWTIKTANYTAVSGEDIQANTTSGAFTITLPATPAANARVRIADYAGTFATNSLTVARNGSNIMGLAENMVINTNNVSIALSYVDATQGWRVV